MKLLQLLVTEWDIKTLDIPAETFAKQVGVKPALVSEAFTHRGNFDEIWKEIRKASFGRNGSLSDCFVAEYVGQMLEYGNFIEHFVSDFHAEFT